MLRCTAAGLMPILNSRRYASVADALFAEKRAAFDAIIGHKSYYLLKALPRRMARALLLPVLPELKARQQKTGLWRGKDSHKITLDILSALDHAELTEEAGLAYSPVLSLRDNHDEYALLIKRLLGAALTPEDTGALLALKQELSAAQGADGSFAQTVTGTVVYLERLLALGTAQDDPVVRRGVAYLLSQRKPTLRGMHTSEPYCLTAANIFSSENREAEFQAAAALKPEWLPRHVCFHTMAMIPNAVCLSLLVRLGLEDDPGVAAALQSLYALYREHGGFCATDIKKPYL